MRYVPEHSSNPSMFGDDDNVTLIAESVDEERTRLFLTRELTHTRFSTRLTAPMGLRQALWLETKQAERSAAPCRARPSQPSCPNCFGQVWPLPASGGLPGCRMPPSSLVLVALHELGHAAAMLAMGVGVGFVRFVPFFGGMAAPKTATMTANGSMPSLHWPARASA